VTSALLLLPVPEAKFQLLGVESHKWIHVALPAGRPTTNASPLTTGHITGCGE
jgi:hypothetical protein